MLKTDKVSKRKRELRILRENWKNCTRCPLGRIAYRHVLYEETHPDAEQIGVMLVGEGPGKSEDGLGKPFMGEAGRFLRNIVLPYANPNIIPIVYTNLLACRPTSGKGSANRPPTDFEVGECSPRLVNLIRIFKPKIVVALGNIPGFYIQNLIALASIDSVTLFEKMYHPSYFHPRGSGWKQSDYPAYAKKMRCIFELAERKLKENEQP